MPAKAENFWPVRWVRGRLWLAAVRSAVWVVAEW